MTTDVVNVRGKKLGTDYDVYCGRNMRAAPYRLPIHIPTARGGGLLGQGAGEPLKAGYFGNPFKVADEPHFFRHPEKGGMQGLDSMEAYREWFPLAMAAPSKLPPELLPPPGFAREVMRLKGLRLGCWCVEDDGSGPCHVQIIAAYLDHRAERR